MNNDIIIFKDKKLSNLLEQIYTNQKDKSYKIDQLIQQLRNMVTTVDQAILLVPAIANYLTIGVKNDQMLLKLTNSITRIMQNTLKEKLLNSTQAGGAIITDAQFQQLLQLSQKQKKRMLDQEQKFIHGANLKEQDF